MAEITYTITSAGAHQIAARVGDLINVGMTIKGGKKVVMSSNYLLPPGVALFGSVLYGKPLVEGTYAPPLRSELEIAGTNGTLLQQGVVVRPPIADYRVSNFDVYKGRRFQGSITLTIIVLPALNDDPVVDPPPPDEDPYPDTTNVNRETGEENLDYDPDGFIDNLAEIGDVTREVDIDITTREVTIPGLGGSEDSGGEGGSASEGGATNGTEGGGDGLNLPTEQPQTYSKPSVLEVIEGDRYGLGVGVLRRGRLQPFPASDLDKVEIWARRDATEIPPILLTEPGYAEMQDLNRFKVMLDLESGELQSILPDFEKPEGATVDLVSQIRLTFDLGGGPSGILVVSSRIFPIRYTQKIGD